MAIKTGQDARKRKVRKRPSTQAPAAKGWKRSKITGEFVDPGRLRKSLRREA